MVPPAAAPEFDAIVIGTGFAGAVTACRLVEAGFNICVLERGRRYERGDFPQYPSEDLFATSQQPDTFRPPPDFSRWLWTRDQGIYDIKDLDDAVSVQAAGYGGGSLIYVNVHLRPPQALFEAWPAEYRATAQGWPMDEYFDLAAYMLRVSPIPAQLTKTVRLQEAGKATGTPWFRTPLAVNFEESGINAFGREQEMCDMRGRCWLGCDHRAKNTLDMNYLARAEQDATHPPDVRTLAEVKAIIKEGDVFTVAYDELLLRGREDDANPKRTLKHVTASYVFLCAGSLNTTELLLKCRKTLISSPHGAPLGSHYFPNSDSLAGVFDCAEPQEADYGPTITAALVHRSTADGEFACSLDFCEGQSTYSDGSDPPAGLRVTGNASGASATLTHAVLRDWGHWGDGTSAGSLLFSAPELESEAGSRAFVPGETIAIGPHATAKVRTPLAAHEHWFMAQDGGYPPTLEPLLGMFQSPLWVRRNRYRELPVTPPATPLRRPPGHRLRLQPLSDSLLGTTRGSGPSMGRLDRSFDTSSLSIAGLLGTQFQRFFPTWFTKALADDRKEFLDLGSALALPLLGRLLGDLSQTVAHQIDSGPIAGMLPVAINEERKQVMVRGLLRQALQVLAGTEAAIASKAAELILNPVPETPQQLLELAADALLWAVAYGRNTGHSALILTMGRDLHRGRLELSGERLVARLPNRLLETSAVMQERLLRMIARDAWHGELRTNPSWTILNKRVTVHSQGGCPMGDPSAGVVDVSGEVHGCPGLYVMDAAAFPTSVGVNPSATITAVAERNIERFIRRIRGNTWEASDKARASAWVDRKGRAAIDPLNHLDLPLAPPLSVKPLGFSFKELMTGFFDDVEESAFDFEDIGRFLTRLPDFVLAEEAGSIAGSRVELALKARSKDLARLISTEPTVMPAKLTLSGWITFRDIGRCRLQSGSFLQLFVTQKLAPGEPLTKFFEYSLRFVAKNQPCVLRGRKVLRDTPGFDIWSDASTVYFEVHPDGGGPTRPARVRRGVLRVSMRDFLETQLPNMDVSGTTDSARRSWGLLAFYKYLAAQLADVYAKRSQALGHLLRKLLTHIHV